MATIQLSYLDAFSLIAYLIVLIYIGYRAYKKTDITDEKDYLLANRSLSLPAFVATLVTTWYGGILGIGEFAYNYGISTWIVFGLPYYIFAALFAFLIAGKVREAGQYTIADILYTRYDKSVGILGSVFLLFMTTPAPYILMISVLLQVILGWPFFLTLIIGTLFSTIYVIFGGFRSVVQTDKFQFFLIYGSFIIIVIFLIAKYGGVFFLKQQIPPLHVTWHGGNSLQYIIVWFFLASWTFIDPGFHQRCSAAKTLHIAKKGILISILFWFIFDFLTVTTGLYAVAIFKEINPLLSYILLADKLLPPFIKGLFFVGLLAVIMSTIDSFSLLSAITFGRDLVWRLTDCDEGRVAFYTRIGLILTGLISVVLCIVFPSVIQLWYTVGTLFIPPMLLPVLTAYFPRYKIPPNFTIISMIVSFSISLLFFLWGQLHFINGNPNYPLGIEPFFPGLLVSVSLYLIYNCIYSNKARRYGRRD
jgi:SSS family solute:Na+ symporter